MRILDDVLVTRRLHDKARRMCDSVKIMSSFNIYLLSSFVEAGEKLVKGFYARKKLLIVLSTYERAYIKWKLLSAGTM